MRKASKRGKNSNLVALLDTTTTTTNNNNYNDNNCKEHVSILTIKSNFEVEHFGVVLLCLVIGLRFFATFLNNRSKPTM